MYNMSDIYNSTKPINQGETQSVKQEAKKERTILDKGLLGRLAGKQAFEQIMEGNMTGKQQKRNGKRQKSMFKGQERVRLHIEFGFYYDCHGRALASFEQEWQDLISISKCPCLFGFVLQEPGNDLEQGCTSGSGEGIQVQNTY